MNLTNKVKLARKKQLRNLERCLLIFIVLVFIVFLCFKYLSFNITINFNNQCNNNLIPSVTTTNKIQNNELSDNMNNAYYNEEAYELALIEEEYRLKIKKDIKQSNNNISDDDANKLSYNIVNIAVSNEINPYLFASIIKVESNYNNSMYNKMTGAKGLTQVTPICIKEVNRHTKENLGSANNEIENLKYGASYLKLMSDKFNNDIRLIVAAYNAGETIVESTADVPNISETQDYVVKVLHNYNNFNN